MKKKFTLFLLPVLILLSLTACTSKDAKEFKQEHEALNGVVNKNGKEHRTISIPVNNPIIKSNAEEIIKKIENKENFYVYFGSALCPWCRSVIEKAMKIANDNGIAEIYYVDIWDAEGNEILRDKYTLDDDKNAVKIIDGTAEYFQLLTYLNDILPDYTYAANKNGGDKLDINEKRIYIPLFVYFAQGKPIRTTSGLSDLQTGSRDELTQEILEDETKEFDDFFINVCDESC